MYGYSHEDKIKRSRGQNCIQAIRKNEFLLNILYIRKEQIAEAVMFLIVDGIEINVIESFWPIVQNVLRNWNTSRFSRYL